jgi:hypothetical protein
MLQKIENEKLIQICTEIKSRKQDRRKRTAEEFISFEEDNEIHGEHNARSHFLASCFFCFLENLQDRCFHFHAGEFCSCSSCLSFIFSFFLLSSLSTVVFLFIVFRREPIDFSIPDA